MPLPHGWRVPEARLSSRSFPKSLLLRVGCPIRSHDSFFSSCIDSGGCCRSSQMTGDSERFRPSSPTITGLRACPQVVENTERHMGLEPAAFSLGSQFDAKILL